MACLLLEAGFRGCAVEGHKEQGQRVNVNATFRDTLSRVAVTETVSVDPPLGGSVAAVATKVAVDDAAATFTEAGTVSAGLLEESDTAVPPVGAGDESVTVQLVAAPASRAVALHASAETVCCATMVKVAVCAEPFRAAVILPDWVAVTDPALAVKLPAVLPAGTETNAGTLSAALFEDRATELPPAPAA
jgi:hypothetical protein